jgi:RNA polymerase sigma factor (sigma-70 family)
MLKNSHDAEDILQNTFVDIFMKLDSFGYQSSIGAWIKRITINNCINFLKSKKLDWTELEGKHLDAYETAPEPTVGLSVELVQKAMSDLADGYRVVFSLYAIEGYDHEEIGQILGISESTSKSQYSRAKQKLSIILKEQITQ